MNKKTSVIISILLLSLVGCTNKYSVYGTGKNIKVNSTEEIKGRSVIDIESMLGAPSFVIKANECTYWHYANYRISENNLTKNHKIDKKYILVIKFNEDMIAVEVKVVK